MSLALGLAGLGGCERDLGQELDGSETGDVEDDALPGIRELDEDAFPQQASLLVEGGQYWVDSRVHLEAGMPIRIWVESVGDDASSPWGDSTQAPDERAPSATAPANAVLVRFAGRSYELGSGDLFHAPGPGSPEFAVNGDDGNIKFRVSLAWGTPLEAHELLLGPLSLASQKAQLEIDDIEVEDDGGWYHIGDVPAGTRLRIRDTSHQSAPSAGDGPDLVPWRSRYVREQSPIYLGYPPGSTLVRLGGKRGRVLPVVGDTWIHHVEGGKLEVSRMGGGSPALISAALMPRLGTAVALLPWAAFKERPEGWVVNFDGGESVRARFRGTKKKVRSGDLVRVRIDGHLADAGQAGAQALDGPPIRVATTDPDFVGDASRGAWLVPGGRRAAVYLRIDGLVIEVSDGDVFYAPASGEIEYAVNACVADPEDQRAVGCQVAMEGVVGRVHISFGLIRRG